MVKNIIVFKQLSKIIICFSSIYYTIFIAINPVFIGKQCTLLNTLLKKRLIPRLRLKTNMEMFSDYANNLHNKLFTKMHRFYKHNISYFFAKYGPLKYSFRTDKLRYSYINKPIAVVIPISILISTYQNKSIKKYLNK